MPDISKILRMRASKRAIVAIAGVAAVGLGIANSVGTQAATQDAVTANGSQIATQNFYPVPVAPSIACSTSGAGGSNRITLTWGSAGPNVKYSVEEYLNNTGSPYYTTTTTGTSFGPWHDQSVSGPFSGWGQTVRMRVYSINTTTNEKSTGYISYSAYEYSYYSTYCSGAAYPQENVTDWQQQGAWTPGAPAQVSGFSAQRMIAPSTTESTPPATTTTTPSTTSSSNTPQPTTSSSTTTPSTGTTTTAPKTTAPATSAPTTTTTTTVPTTATTPSTTTSSTTTSSTAAN